MKVAVRLIIDVVMNWKRNNLKKLLLGVLYERDWLNHSKYRLLTLGERKLAMLPEILTDKSDDDKSCMHGECAECSDRKGLFDWERIALVFGCKYNVVFGSGSFFQDRSLTPYQIHLLYG